LVELPEIEPLPEILHAYPVIPPGAEYAKTDDGHTGSDPVIKHVGNTLTIIFTGLEARYCVALF
jgi:hypothetical protein